MMNHPIKDLTKKEWGLWIGSIGTILTANILSGNMDILTIAAACIGIISLILAAKGNVWAQILMIVFSILYGILVLAVPLLGRDDHVPGHDACGLPSRGSGIRPKTEKK